MTKAEAMIVAAILTNATMAGSGQKLVISADGTLDASVKSENLNVAEVFRIFYRFVIGAAANEDAGVGFPPPPAADPSDVHAQTGNLLRVLQSLAGSAGQVAGVVGGPVAGALAGAIGQAVSGAIPAASIPNPSVPAPPVPSAK